MIKTKQIIEELHMLSREELIKKWNKFFKTIPPKASKRDFLIKNIVWELQAREHGRLSTKTKRKLDKLSEELSKGKEENVAKSFKESNLIEIKAGTKLIREFKGIKHEVTALDKGFEYKSKVYKSLSAIANEITGTRWNGKIFFGIKSA